MNTARRISIGLSATVLLLFGGCSPRAYPPSSVTDNTKVVIRERIIRDSVPYEVVREVERVVTHDTSSHLENSYAVSDAAVKDGMLVHSLESKPQTIYVPFEVTVHDTVTVTEHGEIIIKEVERELTWWQRTKMNMFWLLAAVFVAFAAYKVIKTHLR